MRFFFTVNADSKWLYIVIGILVPTKFEAEGTLKCMDDCQKMSLGGIKAWSGTLAGKQVTVGLCGMGPVISSERACAFIRQVNPQMLVLIGFAGGLDPELKLGDVVSCLASERSGVVHSSAVVVPTAAGKQKLRAETGCRIIEMEADAVAEVASTENIPLTILRVISDDCDEALPECLQYGYNMEKGRESPIRMAFYLATHPSAIAPLKLFLKRTSPLSKYLADALVKHLDATRESSFA